MKRMLVILGIGFVVLLSAALILIVEQQERLLLQASPMKPNELSWDLAQRGSFERVSPNSKTFWWKPNKIDPTKPSVLFCHGNAGSINDVDEMATQIFANHNVFLLEYQGFGLLYDNGNFRDHEKPSMAALVRNVKEAWASLPDPQHTILMGYSMGGGAIAQFLETNANALAQTERLPAQVIMSNTYLSLQRVANDHVRFVPVSVFGWALRCKNNDWSSIKGLQQYLYWKSQQSFRLATTSDAPAQAPFVLLIHALDDPLIRPSHMNKLQERLLSFHQQHLAAHPSANALKRVELPNGGHMASLFVHARLWNQPGLVYQM